MLAAYRILTHLASPLLPLWLRYRATRGREELSRLRERFGHVSLLRPDGPLLWVHAASVGESQTVLPLLEHLLAAYPAAHVLMTTGTVTSAQLLAKRGMPRLLHQYVPVDTPAAVSRFLSHWQPDLAFWVESEFWPNLLQETAQQCPIALINGRLSARSAARWQRFPADASRLMQCFSLLLAGSEADAERLRAIGASKVEVTGNLKFSSPPLPVEAAALDQLRLECTGRLLWLAASTHPGEEEFAGEVHKALAPRHPGLLTLIAPRHPQRGAAIAQALEAQGLRVARRSLGEPISRLTDIYLADTMGELGLFYRLAPIVFVGGSLVPHGGQNPFEAARLGAAVLYGPHMHNFTDFCAVLQQGMAAVPVASTLELQQELEALLTDAPRLQELRMAARQVVEAQSNVESRVWEALRPLCKERLAQVLLPSRKAGYL